jgi:hypothetical protein
VVADRVLVERRHEHAAVHLDADPALAVQPDQRLAHRDAAHAQGLGHLVLRNAIAGAQLAVEDQPPDVEGRLLAAALADERRVGVTGCDHRRKYKVFAYRPVTSCAKVPRAAERGE